MFADRESSGLKVVLLGNSGTGKTSILDFAVTHSSRDDLQPTIGCNCSLLTFDFATGPISLRVWDTAGQELYRSIVPIYIRDSAAALLVYDVTEPKSLESLDHWYSVLMEEQSGEILIYVIANKIDLVDDVRVDEKQGRAVAQKLNGSFHQVSAKTGVHVQELFETVAREASTGERFQSRPAPPRADGNDGGCC
jgi:Ras-related protein Rab-6A